MKNLLSHFRFTDIAALILLGLGGALVHILFNGQYGFHRDELDIIMNARHLDWGYVAYPPFTPFVARVGLLLYRSTPIYGKLHPISMAKWLKW